MIKKSFGLFLLAFGISAIVFKILEDSSVLIKSLVCLSLLGGTFLIIQSKKEIEEEFKKELYYIKNNL